MLMIIPGSLTFQTDLIVHSWGSDRNTPRLMTLSPSCITMQEHTKNISICRKISAAFDNLFSSLTSPFNSKVASCVICSRGNNGPEGLFCMNSMRITAFQKPCPRELTEKFNRSPFFFLANN